MRFPVTSSIFPPLVRLLPIAVAAGLVFSLWGCGGGSGSGGAAGGATTGGGSPSPGGFTSGPPGASTAPRFVFVVEGPSGGVLSGKIAAFRVDAASGNLTPVTGSPFRVDQNTSGITVNPAGTFLFAVSADPFRQTPPRLTTFTIDRDSGAISQSRTITLPTDLVFAGLPLVDPSGRFLYLSENPNALGPANSVLGFSIAADGTLAPVPGARFPSGGSGLGRVTIDQASRFLYVTNANEGTITGFSINSATGELTRLGAPVSVPRTLPTAGKEPTTIKPVLDPAGTHLYIANNINFQVVGFDVSSTGALTSMIGSPFPVPHEAFTPAMDPQGRFLYVTAFNTNQVSGFKVGTAGTLATISGSPFTTVGAPVTDAAVDPSGKFLYVVDDAESLIGYSIDQLSGALTRFQTLAAGGRPGQVIVSK